MSTLAVPIDPNRRRTTTTSVVTEKKSSNFEMEGTTSMGGGGGGVYEQIKTGGETSIGGDRNVSSSSLKKSGVAKKKVLVSTRRVPLWKTVLSVLSKNFILILVLLGLVQMIRKLATKDVAGGVGGDTLGISEFEGRIAEVESFLKTTTKMMQVQVEVMDRKVESEISVLRREIGKKIDEKGNEYETELMRLGVKTAELEKSFSEFKDKGFFTKQDFDIFLEEIGKGNGDGKEEEELSLDDIRGLAKEIVEREIEKHAADGLGMVDYALGSGGGMVLDHSEPFILKKGLGWLPFKKQFGIHQDAQIVVQPSFGEPGKCFPLQGRSGYVVIKLRTTIVPEAVTLEHVSKSVAYDRSSAPKDCRVSGWYRKVGAIAAGGADLSHEGEEMSTLSEFVYDLDKSNAQTFKVESGEKQIVNMIRFNFASNHGASHTCIYRLRVHGHVPDLVAKSEL